MHEQRSPMGAPVLPRLFSSGGCCGFARKTSRRGDRGQRGSKEGCPLAAAPAFLSGGVR
jgi:hypothetical protein